jgi:SPP1 gp7 family putative phage head morphogenesis protein
MAKSWTLSPAAELDEAITWFRKRLAIGNPQFLAMQANAQRQGFWMARVHTAQRAKKIQESLVSALAHGMDFDTWKKYNAAKLRNIPQAHLETTFRNWNQTSYNAARVDYLSHPQVKKRRPYWVFDAVMDGATTPVCAAYNGTVLPAGHPWFLRHTPPLHHNCRSSIRGLTQYQGEQLGIRKRAPVPMLTKSRATGTNLKPGPVSPAPGFGATEVTPWEPATAAVPDGFKKSNPRPAEIELDAANGSK